MSDFSQDVPLQCSTRALYDSRNAQKWLDTQKGDGRLMAGQLSAESSVARGHAAKDTLDEMPKCHSQVESRLPPYYFQ